MKTALLSKGFLAAYLILIGTSLVRADEPLSPATAWLNRTPDPMHQWVELAKAGKGVLAAKFRQGFSERIALFPGRNTTGSASAVAGRVTLWFDSVDQASAFLLETGTGMHLQDGTKLLVDDSDIVRAFTESEIQKLRFGNQLDDGNDPAKSEAIHPRKLVDFRLFDWVRRGTLYWLDKYDGGAFQYRATRKAGDPWAIVSGDPVRVQAMIQNEIDDVRKIHDFVAKKLPHVLVYTLGRREAYIIDTAYMSKRTRAQISAWPEGGAVEQFERSQALLQRYVATSPVATIADQGWSVNIPILNADGSIERWHANGGLAPFSITMLRRNIEEQSGSVLSFSSLQDDRIATSQQ